MFDLGDIGAALWSRTRTRHLARQMVRESLASARRLRALSLRPDKPSFGTVHREVLAFATSLLQTRLQEAGRASRPLLEALLAAIQEEAQKVGRQKSSGAPESNPGRLLPAEDATSDLATRALVYTSGNPQFTEKVFEEFRMATGLSSTILVGAGSNLAALIFYFVMFGLLCAGPETPRSQQQRLLRETRECAQRCARIIEDYLKGKPDTGVTPAAQICSGF